MNTWSSLLTGVIGGQDLTEGQARWVVEEIVTGAATSAQIAAIAVALRAKGESPTEVRAFADALVERSVPVPVDGKALDIVGTGGDQARTVNVSTMAAITAAACGRLVVKHGSRAASSACGTADVLEHLGVAIELDAAGVAEVARRAGISFCFAARFHRPLAHAAPARREIAIPTIFNFLGPLTNPARPRYVAAGVSRVAMGPLLAQVFAARGVAALVFRGEDGLDEITVSERTRVWRVTADGTDEILFDPRDVGVALASRDALAGGDVRHNADVVRAVLSGAQQGPVRDAVLLNAAAGMTAAQPDAADLHTALADGMATAAEAIDSGAVLTTLDRWIEVSQEVGMTRAASVRGSREPGPR